MVGRGAERRMMSSLVRLVDVNWSWSTLECMVHQMMFTQVTSISEWTIQAQMKAMEYLG